MSFSPRFTKDVGTQCRRGSVDIANSWSATNRPCYKQVAHCVCHITGR